LRGIQDLWSLKLCKEIQVTKRNSGKFRYIVFREWTLSLMATQLERFLLSRAVRLMRLISFAVLLPAFPAIAQIIPDQTLDAEPSILNPNGTVNGQPALLIEGGAIRNINLFHSFGEFNVENRQRVYFDSPAGVQNILTRVTGDRASNIRGVLGVDGSANLFLINPNGIVFGPNATLDVNGSFVATTANALQFGNQGVFSASNPDTPPPLTINPSALLFNQLNQGRIVSRASTPVGENQFGLRVPTGQSLLLVGGEVSLSGGLFAPGGHVELAGIDAGSIGLSSGNLLRLNIPDAVVRSDVQIRDGAIAVEANNGGSITINARNLFLDNSGLFAGIAGGQGTSNSQAGDIRLSATRAMNLRSSQVVNEVNIGAIGNAGRIEAIANSLSLTDGAVFSGSTYGRGDAADLSLRANTLVFRGTDLNGFPTRALSRIEAGGAGDAGNVEIEAGTFFLQDGSVLSTGTLGAGNAGNVAIRSDLVSLSGVSPFRTSSNIAANVFPGAVGNGGQISVETGSLFLSDGAQLVAATRGRGNSGSISVLASGSVVLDGNIFISNAGLRGRAPSGLITRVEPTGIGDAGDITVIAGSLSLTNGAQIISNTLGQGDAGNILLRARGQLTVRGGSPDRFPLPSSVISAVGTTGRGDAGEIRVEAATLAIADGAQMTSSTLGIGNANNITLNIRDALLVDGGIPRNIIGTAIFTAVGETGVGQGGDIRITTEEFSVINGGQVIAATLGRGNAGNILIEASDRVLIDGTATNGLSGGLFTSADGQLINRGGNIDVSTPSFQVSNGAVVNALTTRAGPGGNVLIRADRFEALAGGQIITTTFGSGRAGNISLDVTEQLLLAGSDSSYQDRVAQLGEGVLPNVGAESGLFANTAIASIGDGGNILIDPETVIVRDGARISVDSEGFGRGGNIQLRAETLLLDREGRITAETASNQGGNITLEVLDGLLLRRQSVISATAGTAQAGGDGGNLSINSPFVIANSREDSDITANAYRGRGGTIQITTTGIYGLEFRPEVTPLSDITASSAFGVDGVVEIESPDVDPSRRVAELPVDLVDAAGLVDQDVCRISDRRSEFVVTGRGGLPTSPNDVLTPETAWEDWRLGQEGLEEQSQNSPEISQNSSSPLTTEAQGWMVSADGTVVLMAEAIAPPSPETSSESGFAPMNCQAF
jgi:filamentous hemagglutinin family protein